MSDSDRAVQFAGMYLESNRPREALAALAPHLASHPDDAVALSLAANAHLDLDEWAPGREMAQRAVASQPEYAAGWRALALGLAGENQADAAIEAADRAIALNPYDWASYVTRASVDHLLGKVTNQTWEMASKAVQLNPHEPMTHVVQGDIATALRKRSIARRAYSEALRLDPGNEVAQNNLGVLLGKRNVAASASAFIDIVTVDPSSKHGLYNVRVTLTVATSSVHLIIWGVWVIANIAFLRVFSSGMLGDPSYGPALRWGLAATVTVALVAYVLHLRVKLGARFTKFLRTAGNFHRALLQWLVCLGVSYLGMLVAALVPAPWFRLAYWMCMVSLIAGTVLAFRLRKHLKDEAARLDLRLS